MSILTELRKSSPSKIIDLFSADLSTVGGSEVLNFFSDTNELGNSLVFDSETYIAYPFEMKGFEWDGAGQLATPKLTIANLGGLISEYNRLYQDLLGLKVTRIRTMLKYIDAVNFEEGNLEADPEAQFPKEVYFIDRKVAETNTTVVYDLVSALDISSVKLPRRLIIQNICQWRYKDANCNYLPSAHENRMFTSVGTPTTDPLLDVCGKKLSDCKLRFGESSVLNYGAFPGAGLFS
jgi:lambda family phage minor tail protein L